MDLFGAVEVAAAAAAAVGLVSFFKLGGTLP